MKGVAALALLAIAPAVFCGCGASGSQQRTPQNRLIVLGDSIGDIRLDEPRKSVEKALGRGTSKRRGLVSYFGGRLLVDYWFHDGLTTRVEGLETSWAGFHTRSGAHVGSSRQELRRIARAADLPHAQRGQLSSEHGSETCFDQGCVSWGSDRTEDVIANNASPSVDEERLRCPGDPIRVRNTPAWIPDSRKRFAMVSHEVSRIRCEVSIVNTDNYQPLPSIAPVESFQRARLGFARNAARLPEVDDHRVATERTKREPMAAVGYERQVEAGGGRSDLWRVRHVRELQDKQNEQRGDQPNRGGLRHSPNSSRHVPPRIQLRRRSAQSLVVECRSVPLRAVQSLSPAGVFSTHRTEWRSPSANRR
jgi:hypothetical protein